MATDHSSDRWGDQRDPFGDEFYLVPHDEEIRAKAEQMLQDNRDNLRHFVELAIWEALDNPDLLKILLSLLWHWEAVEAKWLAEASLMSVRDVRDNAESEPIRAFTCLVCDTELAVWNRRHGIRLQESVEDYCRDMTGNGPPDELLCKTCKEQENDHVEQQRRLDHERYQALLAEYRARPYAERRETKEWAAIRNRILHRDRYRCRLCSRDDIALDVHHCTYENYAQERLEDLITLCRPCHRRQHSRSEAS